MKMDYTIFKLSFKTPVHFGNGRLGTTADTFFADTLFSALYKEAIKLYGNLEAERLYTFSKEGKLLLSDAMPYCDNTLYIPKPILQIVKENEGDSILKKKFKKLKYIEVDSITDYINGNYNPENELNIGKSYVRTNVSVNTEGDNEPYNVGAYSFNENCGLYFIVCSEDNATDLVFDIMDSLSYTGIGGRLSSGYGKFEYEYKDVQDSIKNRFDDTYKNYMTLSVSMATDNELENILQNASYSLIKRSGFVASEDYWHTPLKKQNFYCFKGGSCFKNKFVGDIFDVSSGGNHPVYRYAKPLLLGL